MSARLAMVCWFLLGALPLRAERLPVRLFNVSNGLAHDLVLVVRQDSRGWLWFGTQGGVSRFDGTAFRNYGLAEGVPEGWVQDVLETREGELLFATGGGVCRLGGSSRPLGRAFECFSPGNADSANEIRTLHQDRFGQLWAGTAGGLYRGERRGRTWHFVRQPLGLELFGRWTEEGVREIVEEPSGGLWLATAVGLAHRTPDGQVTRVRVDAGADDDRVFALLRDRAGLLWIGHVNRGVFVWNAPADLAAAPGVSIAALAAAPGSRAPGSPIRLPDRPGAAIHIGSADGLPDERVRTGFLEDRDGAVWIGTVRGLGRFRAGQLDVFSRDNGLPDDGARPTLIDRAGNLWLGSPSGGAARLRRGGFVSYDATDGLRGVLIRSILEGRDGSLYVLSSAERDYLQRFDGQRFEAVAPRLPGGLATAYTGWWTGQVGFEDRDGRWWLPTGAAGLLRYPARRRFSDLGTTPPSAHYQTQDGLGSTATQVLYEDRRGDVWIGAFSSHHLTVWRRSSERFEAFDEASSDLPLDSPTVFREDADGRLWIGFGDGTLGWFDGARLHRVPAQRIPGVSAIYDLHFDARGALWVASTGSGLLRLGEPTAAEPRARTYTAADGLSSNEVRCVVEDTRGRLYLCTGHGVDRLDPLTGTVARFTTADGLANNLVRVGHRDRHGDLWFGTMQGLSRLVVEPDATPPVASALVTSLELAGVPQPIDETGAPADGLRLETGGDRLRVGFVAPSGDLDVEPAYRYRLEGLESDWSAPSHDHAVTYARLAAGHYRFAVHAVRTDGRPPEAATFELTVLPPLWRRWWFLLAVALAIAAAAFALHRQRLARALAIERVRARIAADLHDDLGASLSRIAVLSEVASRKANAGPGPAIELGQIADTARQLTEEASDMVWAIDPHHDDLGSLLARLRRLAADLLGERGIALEFSGPPNAESIHLSPDQRRHLMLILKEALHNAARHADARRVAVRVEVSDHRIRAVVSDDGKGFDPDSTTPSSTGRGLRNFALRARDLGATVEVRSAAGAGTTVTLSMPR